MARNKVCSITCLQSHFLLTYMNSLSSMKSFLLSSQPSFLLNRPWDRQKWERVTPGHAEKRKEGWVQLGPVWPGTSDTSVGLFAINGTSLQVGDLSEKGEEPRVCSLST